MNRDVDQAERPRDGGQTLADAGPEALRLAQLVLDRAGDAIYWSDRRGRFAYVNETAAQMLGYERQELAGLSVVDIDPDVDPRNWPKIWERLRAQGSTTFKARHKTKSGRHIAVEVRSEGRLVYQVETVFTQLR